ncbi:3' exoribonuclease family, domain 1-domain-containing protein [Dipodascopsis tothii]|uniref:3' exoribonuclease family, domain 1-domain-containing protein n=1 Tax=Dipodascopsis tothii TaxID=44089 RepID=UPI0034CFEB8D
MFLADRRRIVGPPTATPLEYEAAPALQSTKPAADGALALYLRPGLIPTASGSAYIETADYKVLVTVFGPRPIRSSFSPVAKLSVKTKIFLSQQAQQRSGQNDAERVFSDYVQTSLQPSLQLENYPKSAIDVYVTVLSGTPAEGLATKNLLAGCVTAASFATVDAGIEVFDIVTACAVVFTADAGGVRDVVYGDRARGDASGTAVVSYMASRDEVSGFAIDNAAGLSPGAVADVLTRASEGAADVRRLGNAILLESLE